MCELFMKNDFPSKGDIRVHEWEYCRTLLLEDLDEIKKFYRKNPTRVKSDHILVTILNSIGVPYIENMETYYRMVREKANDLAKSLQLTSVYNKGKVFRDGWFFGKMTREIIIANNEAFDPVEAEVNWKDLVPIKVLYHGMTQMVPPILDGGRTFQEGGYTVLMVNIPMLALQYQCWRKEINTKLKYPLGEEHFIRQYPLPNMCSSYLDIALVNRFSLILDNKVGTKNINTHTFYITDLVYKLDPALQRFYRAIVDKKMAYYHMLDILPGVTKPSMRETLELPKLMKTRGVEWAAVLSRLPAVSLLVRLNKASGSKVNRAENSYLRISIQQLKQDGDFNSAFNRYDESLLWVYINTKIAAYLS